MCWTVPLSRTFVRGAVRRVPLRPRCVGLFRGGIVSRETLILDRRQSEDSPESSFGGCAARTQRTAEAGIGQAGKRGGREPRRRHMSRATGLTSLPWAVLAEKAEGGSAIWRKTVLISAQAFQDPKDAPNEFVSNAADEVHRGRAPRRADPGDPPSPEAESRHRTTSGRAFLRSDSALKTP